jgi:hypothetical protein
MKIWLKVALVVSLSFMCVFTSLGYAGISSQLEIFATAEAVSPDFDGMVIKTVTVCSGTTASQITELLLPTNVKTTVTGNAGQKIVYKITAYNDSEDKTYVYTGTAYDQSYAAVADKVAISASLDEANSKVIPASRGHNYYEGTPIAPGEEITFYVTYTLDSSITSGEMLINFKFVPVVYTITYMTGNNTYAIDCITDNSIEYAVKESGPNNGNLVFTGWVNANAERVYSYPAGNTHSYTLSAKWSNVYLIMFVDYDGNVIYQETFTDSSKSLSAAGQAIVDAKLAEWADEVDQDEISVAWESYNIASATSDITVRPIYTYTGNLKFTPKDRDGDGITDYYQVDAVAKLKDPTKIPGRFMGLDVEVVNKLYLNEDNSDYGAGVNTIEIGEGVKQLNHNSLAHTADLDTVKLPSTIEVLGKNVFSRNWSNDRKVLTIEYNGTMAEWNAIQKDADWHNGLLSGSRVICSDGYFELDRGGLLILGIYNWKAYPN